MREIIVKSQEEYDKIKDQKEFTIIKIESTEEWIRIKKVPENCYVKAYDSAYVKAYDSAYVEAYGSAYVEAFDSAHVEAYEWSYVVKFSGKVEKYGDAIVREDFKYPRSVEEWCRWYGIKINNGTVKLFKAVREDYTDFYSGEIKYEIGKVVECPDWDDEFTGECGHGLHLSAIPSGALYFVSTGEKYVLLECEVNLEDIRIYNNGKPFYPFKVRCKKVKVLRKVEEGIR